MSNFVIYGTQRTGTTLICTSLNSHPKILCLGELFDPNENYKPKEMLIYSSFIKNSHNFNQSNAINDKESIFSYLNIFYSKTNYKGIGFKLMLNQVKNFSLVLEYLKSRNIKIIKAIRENVLETYISRKRSQETNVYHSTELKSARNFVDLLNYKVYINTDSLIRSLDAISKENEELNESVRALGLKYITVEYNGLINRKSSQFDRILAFLEIENEAQLFSNLEKVSPSKLEDSIENYGAVLKTLKYSKYSSCLNEWEKM